MNIDLIYTPTADPTCPWGSLYMLKGYLDEHSGHRATVRDLNLEWLYYLSEPEQIDRLRVEIAQKQVELESKPELTALEQFQYYRILRPIEPPKAEEIRIAFDILRCPSRFYDIESYSRALLTLKRWEHALSRVTYPGVLDKFTRFGFGPYLNPMCAKDVVADVKDNELGFFFSFLRERYLPDLLRRGPQAIGISIPFRFQLWHAVALAREVRRVAPAIKLVAGGTALQMFKYANLHDRVEGLHPLFSLFDAVVVGEGEQALKNILDAWEAGESDFVNHDSNELKSIYANVLTTTNDKVVRPKAIEYLDLNKLSCPNYADASWGQYLSPEPFMTYSPTRGCYWDRCVFCELGLAGDRPTSPSRERAYDLVIADLERLQQIGRHVYWSVDAIRPGWMVEIARRIAACGLNVKWGAEVRLDRRYTAEEADILKAGGCLAISVGIESGSDRLLALMDKGAAAERYATVLQRLRQAGIAVYPMTFVGFPTETVEEANGTIDFLLRNYANLSMIAMPATFYLEGNAIITKRPDDFGLLELKPFRNLDAPNGWYWRSSVPWSADEQRKLVDRLETVSTQIMGLLDRPFLGGIDTPHSALYVEKYGPDAIKNASNHFKSMTGGAGERRLTVRSPFDLAVLRSNIIRLEEELHADYEEFNCPCGEVTNARLARIAPLRPGEMREQNYDPEILTALDQWLDINFSRDQAHEERMYTQRRPGQAVSW